MSNEQRKEIQQKMLHMNYVANDCHEHVMKIEKAKNEFSVMQKYVNLHPNLPRIEIELLSAELKIEKLKADNDFLIQCREVKKLAEEIKSLAIELFKEKKDFQGFRKISADITEMRRFERILGI